MAVVCFGKAEAIRFGKIRKTESEHLCRDIVK